MNTRTKKITMVAMLCAIAYVVVVVCRVPIFMFLSYEPKDVIITIGGFLFGPLTSLVVSVIVSFVEMFTISDTGIIGCIMNILSSCAFACVAAYIYKKKHTLLGAVIGLTAGCVAMTIIMLIWNYLITPIYMGYPREAVAEMLIPIFLPFNLLKSGINMAVTILIYKPIVTALRKAGLVEVSNKKIEKNQTIGIMLIGIVLLATCIFFVLVVKGIL
jgi:riboflavin transporter